MNSDFNQLTLQRGSFDTSAEIPSGTRVPPPKIKSRERGKHFVKADISVEDQLKYRTHLLLANRNFVGFSKENLDIIAISFEHLCFSEAGNLSDYKKKIHTKLKEWKYDGFLEDEEEIDGRVQTRDNSAETGPDVIGEIPVPVTPSSFTTMPPAPKSSGSSKGSKFGAGPRSPIRARGASPPQKAYPSFSLSPSLFDPMFLEKINLNDPARRALWVEAVWRYFNSGGRPPAAIDSIRRHSFATIPTHPPPPTPTIPQFQPMVVQHQEGGGYEYMDGLETYRQETQLSVGGDGNLAQMVDIGALSPGTSFVQEQWRNLQDHDIS